MGNLISKDKRHFVTKREYGLRIAIKYLCKGFLNNNRVIKCARLKYVKFCWMSMNEAMFSRNPS